ncbi:MAG: hypothetical protein LBS64_02265 [Spirochaetaceae bacterium]|jgi:hypothetical protein|nr:hypothetical protein [Spirochaetaceae bacterium]
MPRFRLALLCALCLLAACSDSPPELAEARLIPVFEFSQEKTRPSMFVHLLVHPTSDLTLADSIALVQPDTGFVWRVTGATALENPDAPWVTGPRLAPAVGAGFSEGTYRVVYTDSSERAAQVEAPLTYLPEILSATIDTVAQYLPDNAARRLAVYDAQGFLLYFGSRGSDLGDDTAIRAKYPLAFSWRECISPPGNALGVLLPMTYANIEEITLGDETDA